MHTATAVPSPSKSEMRKAALGARHAFARGLSLEERVRLEERVAAQVLAEAGQPEVVAGYVATADEIDPAPLLRVLQDGGSTIVYPWFAGPEATMIFGEGPADRPGPFGVPQPSDTARKPRPDLMIVPLVAADARCHRIGRGGGHYDQFLNKLRRYSQVRTIGIGWDVQLLDIPIRADRWDIPLDVIATPSRWIKRNAS